MKPLPPLRVRMYATGPIDVMNSDPKIAQRSRLRRSQARSGHYRQRTRPADAWRGTVRICSLTNHGNFRDIDNTITSPSSETTLASSIAFFTCLWTSCIESRRAREAAESSLASATKGGTVSTKMERTQRSKAACVRAIIWRIRKNPPVPSGARINRSIRAIGDGKWSGMSGMECENVTSAAFPKPECRRKSSPQLEATARRDRRPRLVRLQSRHGIEDPEPSRS